MKKMFLIALLLTAWPVASPLGLLAQQPVPDTPAGHVFEQLMQAVNDDPQFQSEFWSKGFADNDPETLQRRQAQTAQLRSQLGKLAFRRAQQSSEYQLTAECEASAGPNVVLTIAVTEEAPHRIKSIALEMGGSEPVDQSPLDPQARADVVARMAEELRAKYVFPDVGEKMAAVVENSLKQGDYDKLVDVREFARHLTDQLREICHDKHLGVRAGSPSAPGGAPGRRPEDNHGFVKAEMLPGGIGYLKFNFFSGDPAAEPTAAAAMNFLGNSRALIFDLRQNGGGSPQMIAFLSSYLFDEPVHLNSFYNRPTDTTTETWTRDEVPGKRLGKEVPVYVLTSSYTFSGAEEFSYNLKNLQRGTIVGETTGGGAHPVMLIPLGKRMSMSMPFARAINPITGTNWEGVGVEPDVQVAAADALQRAVELATERIKDASSPAPTGEQH